MQEKVTFENSKGDKLVGVLSSPAGIKDVPIMILCHGFSSSKDSSSYIHLEQELNDMNIATFRFDFYGHGESAGKFEDVTITEAIDDTNRAIDCVKGLSFESSGFKLESKD